MLAASLYSIGGLVIGIVIGKWFCTTDRMLPMFWKTKVPALLPTDAEGIPVAIPKVEFDKDGEPVIARERIVKESPVPRWLTVMIVILTLASVGYLWVTREQAKHDAAVKNQQLTAQTDANSALIASIKHDEAVNEERQQRLEDLILAISTATTPEEANAAIQKYLRQSAEAHQRERRYQERHGGGSGGAHAQPSADTQGSRSPQPSPESSPSHSSKPSPSAHPSHSPSPKPTPKPSICVTTPRGQVCAPIPPIPTLAPVPVIYPQPDALPVAGRVDSSAVAMWLRRLAFDYVLPALKW